MHSVDPRAFEAVLFRCEAWPYVSHFEQKQPVFMRERHAHRSSRRVFGRILECFADAEIDCRFDFWRVPLVLDIRRDTQLDIARATLNM